MGFKNKCPVCGKQSLVYDIFFSGNEYGNKGRIRWDKSVHGHSKDGLIVCTQCGAEFSTQGRQHTSSNQKLLTVNKARFKSDKQTAYNIIKGKQVHNKVVVEAKHKNNANTTTRKTVCAISKTIKNLSISIVGNKTGYSALREIVAWMDKKIAYAKYTNFKRSPETVVDKGTGNCCDQTRLFLQLCDAAGLTDYYNLYYCIVPGHLYAIIESKKTGKRTAVDCASDKHTAWAYIIPRYRSDSETTYRYPTRPI